MSTFGTLNTAYTGLIAARRGLDVVGQNIANANTDGYTRQRVTTSASVTAPSSLQMTATFTVGQGVSVDGVARLGSTLLDARVRTATAVSGYWDVRSSALSSLEQNLQEPGANGLSTTLQKFWSAWQDLGNNAAVPATGTALITQATGLASQIAGGYRQVDTQWSTLRTDADAKVAALNDAGARVADLNGQIRMTLAAGGSANELIDQRDTLMTTISKLAGGTARDLPNGTTEILIGGNPIVSGDHFNAVSLVGSYHMDAAGTDPVQLTWANGNVVALDGGELGGSVAVLAAANGSGTGGVIAEAAASYSKLATELATKVNAVYSTGANAAGTTGANFFSFAAGLPPAVGLTVVPTTPADLATATPGAGAYNGDVAGAIAQLGTGATSPDSTWAGIVSGIGTQSRTAQQQSTLAGLATTAATNNQLSNAGVDLDEENVNMLSFQRAYQGAARVMTAVDEMIDTLINHTGLVGR
ncbi:MAG TPA: flagellar hook-associated protein FlgK [Lacisediminihabitans sp.]|nr:flagellar hook-associated protein FlgK [Lacisediminihabitans sp.]HXD62158.1 flagellar hook-associated protein FlgK [Lacisediminihabitans sp.]